MPSHIAEAACWLVNCCGIRTAGEDHALDSPENFNPSDFLAEERARRFEKARKDIARRLQKICSELPEEDFRSLVDKMARAQVRSEGNAL